MENQPITNSPETTPLNSVPINQVPTPPYTKTSLFVPILLTLLVSAVVFGFGGYYLGMKSLNTQEITKNIQNSPVPTLSATPSNNSTLIPTASAPSTSVSPANWETYTGSEYSFRHPAGLKSDTGAAGAGVESIRFQFMGPKQVASGRTQTSLFDGYSFIVTKIGLVSQKTPEQLTTEQRNNSKDNCGSEVVLSGIKNISLDKASGVQYSVKNCMGDYTSSYISSGSNVYEIIQLYVGDTSDQKGYEEITNQIFNTLKFL